MAARILIVDDEPNIVVSLEYLIRREGWQTHGRPRRRGSPCSELEGSAPDLVILDVMLPEAERVRGVPSDPRRPAAGGRCAS